MRQPRALKRPAMATAGSSQRKAVSPPPTASYKGHDSSAEESDNDSSIEDSNAMTEDSSSTAPASERPPSVAPSSCTIAGSCVEASSRSNPSLPLSSEATISNDRPLPRRHAMRRKDRPCCSASPRGAGSDTTISQYAYERGGARSGSAANDGTQTLPQMERVCRKKPAAEGEMRTVVAKAQGKTASGGWRRRGVKERPLRCHAGARVQREAVRGRVGHVPGTRGTCRRAL
jgi:hypothetical protein